MGTGNMSLEQLDNIERTKYLPLTIILVLIMLIGIIGNSLVLIIYKTKFKRSSARCYILSLAMADLSVCVVGIPYHVLDLTLILTYTYANVCRVLSFLIGACTMCSVFILLVVGLDRYMKVCRPLKRQIRDFGDKKACFLATFAAVVISIPNGIIYGESSVHMETYNITGVECFIDDTFHGSELAVGYLGFNMFLFILSVIFLIIIYGFICRKIFRHDQMAGEITLKSTRTVCFCCKVDKDDEEDESNDMKGATEMDVIGNKVEGGNFENVPLTSESSEGNGQQTSVNKSANSSSGKQTRTVSGRASTAMIRHIKPGSKQEEKNTRKITLMMFTITVVFIVAYLPFIILSIIDSLVEDFWTDLGIAEAVLYDLLLRLYLINNVANPVIYSFWDQRFRKHAKRLLRNMLFCWKKDDTDVTNNERSTTTSSSAAYSRRTEADMLKSA